VSDTLDSSGLYAGVRAQIADGRMCELFDYWDGRRGGKAMPSRIEVDPLDLPLQLPNLFLIDVEAAPRRYRYRLVGSALTEIVKEDLSGMYVDQMPALWRHYAEPPYDEAVATGQPHYREVRIVRTLWRARYLRLLLPLGEPQAPAETLLACIYRL
jgi:hypothetical protein